MTFPSNSFDIAIDKATLDAMLYGSLWDPELEVRRNVGAYVDEVSFLSFLIGVLGVCNFGGMEGLVLTGIGDRLRGFLCRVGCGCISHGGSRILFDLCLRGRGFGRWRRKFWPSRVVEACLNITGT